MLLKRDRSVSQRTSWTWRTAAVFLAAAAVTISANQFGVVYAQTTKKAATTGADALVETILQTKEGAKTDPIAKTRTADDRPAKTGAGLPSDMGMPSADPNSAFGGMTSGGADPLSAWDALRIQIADRRAKLAGAHALPGNPPFEALRLELEIMALESAKRQLASETRLAAAEKQLLERQVERERVQSELGPDHPHIRKLNAQIERLQDQQMRLQKELEIEQQQTDDRIRARAQQVVRTAEKDNKPGKTQADGQKTPQRASSEKASKTVELNRDAVEEVQRRYDAARAELAKLNNENQELRHRFAQERAKQADASESPKTKAAAELGTTLRTLQEENSFLRSHVLHRQQQPAGLDPASAVLGQSLPFLKHQLRMAEAEPMLHEQRLAYYESDFQRIQKLAKHGGVSQEELQKAKLQVELADAELQALRRISWLME